MINLFKWHFTVINFAFSELLQDITGRVSIFVQIVLSMFGIWQSVFYISLSVLFVTNFCRLQFSSVMYNNSNNFFFFEGWCMHGFKRFGNIENVLKQIIFSKLKIQLNVSKCIFKWMNKVPNYFFSSITLHT